LIVFVHLESYFYKANSILNCLSFGYNLYQINKGNQLMDFKVLADGIGIIDESLRRAAVGSVNRMLTVRNWLIGRYIVEFEQDGEDRAEYGERLIPTLSLALQKTCRGGFSERNLQLFRLFFKTYPHFSQLVTAELSAIPELLNQIHFKIPQSPTAELQSLVNQSVTALSPEPQVMIRHFSFTHFVEFMRLSEPLKRAFYEIEGIKGCWSVSELKRQIESLLFERTGLSKDKKGLIKQGRQKDIPASIDDAIRDPYILEFTGFPESYQFSESDLESALLDHIQSFLLELGNGFCFEARQKRISLDNENDRIDLVFYHRILRCHVLIDLKVRKFRHSDAGQMNFYLNYYRDNVMVNGDNPPVGLILCTFRDETVVKYATSGLDNNLFVSKYQVNLPTEKQLVDFLSQDRGRTELRLEEQRAHYNGETQL
jgi:predicted nuclease of restriction endonuclease-like (RecB) superfamily